MNQSPWGSKLLWCNWWHYWLGQAFFPTGWWRSINPQSKNPSSWTGLFLKKLLLISSLNNLFSVHSHMMQCFLARSEHPRFSLIWPIITQKSWSSNLSDLSLLTDIFESSSAGAVFTWLEQHLQAVFFKNFVSVPAKSSFWINYQEYFVIMPLPFVKQSNVWKLIHEWNVS